MTDYDLDFKPYGNRSILIEWPEVINENILHDLLAFKNALNAIQMKQRTRIKTAYNSLLVTYDAAIENFYQEVSRLQSHYAARKPLRTSSFHTWYIPVCYDQEFGLDLRRISEEKQRDISEIIRLHSDTHYTVYFIGFLPGFLYLGGLPDDLAIPRKASPRLNIAQGAVAIGGSQTGVYPIDSPGGWHIIGNSPVNFFDAGANPPCFAKAGDTIQFVAVSYKTHQQIKEQVASGRYILENEVIHD